MQAGTPGIRQSGTQVFAQPSGAAQQTWLGMQTPLPQVGPSRGGGGPSGPLAPPAPPAPGLPPAPLLPPAPVPPAPIGLDGWHTPVAGLHASPL